MAELVSGWSDDNNVYLIERHGDVVKYRKVPARWSAFFTGFDDADRVALSRTPEVRALELDKHGYTRVDFIGRFERDAVVRKVEGAIKRRRVESLEHTPVSILEADVRPLRRLLSDSPHLHISTSPRLVWLDLEVDPRRGFEDMRTGRARIVVWSLYRLVDGKEQLVAEETLATDSDDEERCFLGRLYEALGAFDVVLSWNGYDFDFPVLESRSNKLRVKMPRGGKVPLWNRWCWLDQMLVYQKYNQAHESGEERSSVSLNAVAKNVLGEGKQDFNARLTWEAWKAGGAERARLSRYCSHDTSLMPRIEAKTGFIALHLAVCHVTRCFPDTNSLRATDQGDGFLLALGAQRGYRFPTKTFGAHDDEKSFDGAYVMPPKKLGAIDDVHVCDFSALYPSIMKTWNMSPDTLIPYRDVDTFEGTKCKLPAREVHFSTTVRGIVPVALDELQAQRDVYSAKSESYEKGTPEADHYSRLSAAMKIINNSMYGIVGSPFARFYDPTIAEGVTQTGKWLILHVAATMEATNKLRTIYGDTDSVFAQGHGELFGTVVKSLNEGWEAMVKAYGCPKSYIKLAFEKTFARLILKSAKCYAGKYELYKGKKVGPDKKPEVRGLEYKRGDALRLARQMQYELIKLLLPDALPQPPLPGVEDLRAWVLKWRERVLHSELSLEDVMLSKSVKGLDEYSVRYTTPKCSNKMGVGKAARSCGFEFPHGTAAGPQIRSDCPKCGVQRKMASQPVHVRVARLLQERGEQMTPGTRIEYLVVRGGEEGAPEDKMNAVPASDPGVMERLDRDYYWDRLVYPATQRLLEVVYPKESWTDTVAQRRKALVAAEREEKKNKYDDLPLFGEQSAVHPGGLESVAAKPPPAAALPRRRRAPPVALHRAEVGAPVVLQLVVRGEEEKLALIEAIAAAVRAHPGEVPVVLEVELKEPAAHVRMKTQMCVARTRDAIGALERLEIPGVLKVQK